MGIGRQQARSLIATVRTGTPNRSRLVEELGDSINLLLDMKQKLEIQLATAEKAFANDRQTAFNTFVDGLPLPDADQTP